MGSPSIYVFDCSNAGCIVDYIRKNVPLVRDQQDAVNVCQFSWSYQSLSTYTLSGDTYSEAYTS